MIDSKVLLADSVSMVNTLLEDLRERYDEGGLAEQLLHVEWLTAQHAGRTGIAFKVWREDRLTQIAVAWVLSCVFIRFCEDNELIDIQIAGPGDRLQIAKDRYTEFVTKSPQKNQQSYLLEVFEEMKGFSATERLFGEHNPVWEVAPSAFGCKELLEFWWRLDETSGELRLNFADSALDTRFLGDLYQDISADVRAKYALLQTPDFVESFILDRTLDPAIDEFGLADTDLIDPACGSGHFLLGAFDRLFKAWRRAEPTANKVAHAERALAAIAGVDLNPYAVAIARFRLLIAAMNVCGIKRLVNVHDFSLRVAVGDSLLHGPTSTQQRLNVDSTMQETKHLYETEDPELLDEVLSKTYKAVVANPPYITVKDKAANASYRRRYNSCKGKYSLGVPFTERLFGLAQPGAEDAQAGFVGQITANSFMKREFGSKLVEEFLPTWDLTGIIDMSGAYIPGHGTPTIIMFARNRVPVTKTVRAVMGLRGEPSTPTVPAEGLVWTAIEKQVDEADSTTEYVRSVDWPRKRLQTHPVVFGGGADLWFRVDAASAIRVSDLSDSVGINAIPGCDPVFLGWSKFPDFSLPAEQVRVSVSGTEVRDWALSSQELAWFPYDESGWLSVDSVGQEMNWIWPQRTVLGERRTFSKKSYFEEGRPWWGWHQVTVDRLKARLSIAFAFVATHNHFVLDRGGKVFKQSAPVIKLPQGATEDDHLKLLGPLNSSVGCFWLKQVSHNKGSTVDKFGARQTTVDFENFFEFTGTQLKEFPLVDAGNTRLAEYLDRQSEEVKSLLPQKYGTNESPNAKALAEATQKAQETRRLLVAAQESLDWRTMHDYGLIETDLSENVDSLTPIQLGERAFEIVLARRVAAGLEETTWFKRHGSTPVTELPDHWSDEYRNLVEQRIAAIEADPAGVGFIEKPEFKRRWNWESWHDLQANALREWLIDAIENLPVWRNGSIVSVSRITQTALTNVEGFGDVAELYAGADVSVPKLVGELLASEAAPYVAGLRLKPSGMRKRAVWEKTWELQRHEDRIDSRSKLESDDPNYLTETEAAELKAEQIGTIDKPPVYSSADMVPTAWKHRGKLDVPKERFIFYPDAQATDGDTSPLFGWAGWNHAEQGRALAEIYVQRKPDTNQETLTALLAGIWELVPWVKQWHNEPDPQGRRNGDQLESFVQREISTLGLTIENVTGWAPPPKTKSSKTRATSK